jgi:UDP-N-acetylmuramoyl-L-alanyl-D-glutamate--2,6-diaminopimelate ligase
MIALGTILENLPSFVLQGDTLALKRVVASVTYDSRACTPDALFVAIPGLKNDGHDFVLQAITNGATVVVLEREMEVPSHVALVIVPDSRIALALLSHAWYGEPSVGLRIIGVTGTNGKTTTTFILKSLLEAMGEVVGIIGTTGSYIRDEILPSQFTTPEAPELCALLQTMKQRGATSVVMEVSSHALALHRVHGTIFAGGIFTNLTQDHLDFHETMEAYAAAKQRLFSTLPRHAVAVVNADDDYGNVMIEDTNAQTTLSFGRSPQADIRIAEQTLGFTKTDIVLTIKGEEVRATMPLVGRFNGENLAASVAMVSALGASVEQIAEAIPHMQGAPGRMQRIELPDEGVGTKPTAIVDYAHTPDALEKALLSCRELLASETDSPGKIFCVIGCGGDRDRTKRPLMGAIAVRLADIAIFTSDNPRSENPVAILDDMLSGVPHEKFTSVVVLADRREAIRYAMHKAAANDIVLVAGKGHETYQIIGSERSHFDDREEIEKAFAG